MMNNRKTYIITAAVLLIIITCIAEGRSIHGKSPAPSLSGRLIYHSYSDYDNNDSRLYLYDFKENKLSCISNSFDGVHNCMNAMFHPKKDQITFMAISDSGQWDIYTYNFHGKKLTDITKKRHGSHEDPKYSPNGNKIVFKETVGDMCRICEYSLRNKKFSVLKSSSTELSMPFYSRDGKCIYYAHGDGSNSRIMKLKDHKSTCLYRKKHLESYYPIASGYKDILYFSRWDSRKNHADQIYSLNLRNNKARRLKFNRKDCDTSDFCEVTRKYAIVSSTRGNGSYDLYLAPLSGQKARNLNTFNKKINTKNQELGADYKN